MTDRSVRQRALSHTQSEKTFYQNEDIEQQEKNPDDIFDGSGYESPSLEPIVTAYGMDDELVFAEGGTEAWKVVFGSWCALFGCFGIWNTVGIFQAWLSENDLRNYSEGTISWIFSVYSFLFFFCGVQVGPIFDKYGARCLLILGSTGFILSLMLFSICKEYYQYFLSFGVLGGISCSLMFTPAIAVITHWFNVRRGFATGIAATGGGFGGVVFPLVLQSLIKKIGFAWAIRSIGLICLLTSFLATLLIRSRFKGKSTDSAVIDLSAFKDIRFVLTTAAIFTIEWALQIPQTYYTSFAIAKGISSSLAYQMIAIMNSASIAGRFMPGYFADVIGRYNMIILTIIMCSVFVYSIWLPTAVIPGTNLAGHIVYLILFGFGSGSGISLTPVCLSQICETKDYGKRYGTLYSFASIGTLTGVPIAGAILGAQGANNYNGLIIFCGGCYILSTIFFICARGVAKGWSFRLKY
ncbi:major facilitator superfamily domain-containing protein [Dipodascopsis uninucleata]